MNLIIEKQLNATYEIMRKHRQRDDKANKNMRRCNKCGKYYPIEETRMIRFGTKNYRYCNYCRVKQGQGRR